MVSEGVIAVVPWLGGCKTVRVVVLQGVSAFKGDEQGARVTEGLSKGATQEHREAGRPFASSTPPV